MKIARKISDFVFQPPYNHRYKFYLLNCALLLTDEQRQFLQSFNAPRVTILSSCLLVIVCSLTMHDNSADVFIFLHPSFFLRLLGGDISCECSVRKFVIEWRMQIYLILLLRSYCLRVFDRILVKTGRVDYKGRRLHNAPAPFR